MTTLLVLMLILSAALNVRQFQVWRAAIRDARAAKEDAARMKRMADSAWELYEYEEAQNWTEKGVACTVKQLPISQAGEPSTSLVEIKVSEVLFPVYLRLWCSSDVRTLPLPDIKIDNPGEPPKDTSWSPPTDSEKPVPIRSEGKGLAEIRIRDVSLTSESVLRLALESQSGEELQVFRVQRPKE